MSLLCWLQAIYDAADPVSISLPGPWFANLDAFQRLLLLRVIRPDKLTVAIHAFVKATLGAKVTQLMVLRCDQCS
jgi:dynein heavy chain